MKRSSIRALVTLFAIAAIVLMAVPGLEWFNRLRVPQQTLAALRDPDLYQRLETLSTLHADYPVENRRALIRALEDGDEEVRCRAASYLVNVPNLNYTRSALIRHLQTDPSKNVRLCCAAVLASDPAPEVTQAFIGALHDTNKRVIWIACAVLRNRGSREAVPALYDILDHLSWRVRLEACKSLIQLNAADKRVVATLEKMRRDREAKNYDARVEDEERRLREQGQPPEIMGGWGKLEDIIEQAKVMSTDISTENRSRSRSKKTNREQMDEKETGAAKEDEEDDKKADESEVDGPQLELPTLPLKPEAQATATPGL